MKLVRNLMAATALAALGAGPALAERGADGQVNILYWQAVSIMNPYLSGGTKEIHAASMVLEPFAHYDGEGNMVPVLAEEIPTVENGGISADLLTITWRLKEGLLWSDGTPVTSADVVFTGAYCMHPEGGCASSSFFTDVVSIEAVDPRTVKITFGVPKPFPYGPFVGAEVPILQEAQFKDCVGAKAPTCTEANFYPIGTGAFTVVDFKANDTILLEANANYRDPAKPAFQTVLFKGGGDAASAARAVLETGEFDYAWNLQVEPEILRQMEAAGKGTLVTSFGPSVERIEVNFTNPDPALPPELRSVYADGTNPHPILSDPAVRRALSLAIDRSIIVEAGYGAAGQVTCNVLPAPAIYASTANDWCKTQDIAEANRLLDEAGWTMGADGVRVKDGMRLSFLFQTSTNSVRQGTQALLKQMWSEIGVEVELRNIDASVFFGGDQSSPDTFQKFFADIEMFTNNFPGTDPEQYMANWICSEVPGPDNQWLGENVPRFCDPAYDALVATLAQTAGLEERAAIAKQLNDMLMSAGALIPLVHRGNVSARALTLGGDEMTSWDSELWDIADWYRVK